MRDDDEDEDDEDDRPRRKKRRRDDDEDDDRPRRRKKRTSKKSSSTGLILGLVGGVVALLLLVGGGVYLLMNQSSSNAQRTAGGNTPAPAPGPVVQPAPGGGTGWTNFRQPDGLYSVKLPPGCLLPQFSELKQSGADKQSVVLTGNRDMAVGMKVRVLSPASLAQEQKNLQDLRGNKRQINWLGRAAVEESDPNDRFGRVVRQFLDGDRLFHFEIGGLPRKPTDEERRLFFDSVVIDPR